jgi:hypothetical protein
MRHRIVKTVELTYIYSLHFQRRGVTGATKILGTGARS